MSIITGTRTLVALGCFLTASTHAQSERPTIPELLRQSGKSLEGFTTVPSGVAPSIDQVIDGAEIVVRGIVGQPRSYLSNDQRDVYTEYPIRNPVILYQTEMQKSATPGVQPMIAVTLQGGTITVDGLKYTKRVEALPSLDPGTECLFILDQDGARYSIAGSYYGVFRILDGKVQPLTRDEKFAAEYRDASAAQFEQRIVARLLARQR